MAKYCSQCGKKIENAYYLDGKIYGHECYKMALSLKYTALEQQKNDSYTNKCIALIEIFRNKTFKDTWNKDFQTSVLKQFDECHKLTGKQFDVIVKKFDDKEYINYLLIYTEIYQDREIEKYIYNQVVNAKYLLSEYKNNEMFIRCIKTENEISIKRSRKLYIVEYKDIDEPNSIGRIIKADELEELKNDEYIEIISVQEV
jgi:hypothetical protein